MRSKKQGLSILEAGGMTKEELARVTNKEALRYTVWLVQPEGKLGARVFGRECWGPVVVLYKWSSPPPSGCRVRGCTWMA